VSEPDRRILCVSGFVIVVILCYHSPTNGTESARDTDRFERRSS